jgi:hypothetical protein
MALVRQTLPFDVLHAAAPADTQVRFSHHVDMFYPKKCMARAPQWTKTLFPFDYEYGHFLKDGQVPSRPGL